MDPLIIIIPDEFDEHMEAELLRALRNSRLLDDGRDYVTMRTARLSGGFGDSGNLVWTCIRPAEGDSFFPGGCVVADVM